MATASSTVIGRFRTSSIAIVLGSPGAFGGTWKTFGKGICAAAGVRLITPWSIAVAITTRVTANLIQLLLAQLGARRLARDRHSRTTSGVSIFTRRRRSELTRRMERHYTALVRGLSNIHDRATSWIARGRTVDGRWTGCGRFLCCTPTCRSASVPATQPVVLMMAALPRFPDVPESRGPAEGGPHAV